MDIETLSTDQASVLLYAESCIVDQNGFMEGRRMNAADILALEDFARKGLIVWGRVPAKVIEAAGKSSSALAGRTHWVRFTNVAWKVAHDLRRAKALRTIGTVERSVILKLWQEYDASSMPDAKGDAS